MPKTRAPTLRDSVPSCAGETALLPSAPSDSSTTDPELMPAIVRRLDEAGVVVAELNLRRPSLDDVFLSLTGHAPANPGDPGAGQPETGVAPERSLA